MTSATYTIALRQIERIAPRPEQPPVIPATPEGDPREWRGTWYHGNEPPF